MFTFWGQRPNIICAVHSAKNIMTIPSCTFFYKLAALPEFLKRFIPHRNSELVSNAHFFLIDETSVAWHGRDLAFAYFRPFLPLWCLNYYPFLTHWFSIWAKKQFFDLITDISSYFSAKSSFFNCTKKFTFFPYRHNKQKYFFIAPSCKKNVWVEDDWRSKPKI